MSKSHKSSLYTQSDSSNSNVKVSNSIDNHSSSENSVKDVSLIKQSDTNNHESQTPFKIPETLLKRLTPVNSNKPKISLKEKLMITEKRRQLKLNEKISKLNKQTNLILEKIDNLNRENHVNSNHLRDKLLKSLEIATENKKIILDTKRLAAKKISESITSRLSTACSLSSPTSNSSPSTSDERLSNCKVFGIQSSNISYSRVGSNENYSGSYDDDDIDEFFDTTEELVPEYLTHSNLILPSSKDKGSILLIQRLIRRFLLNRKIDELRTCKFFKDFQDKPLKSIMNEYLNDSQFVKSIDRFLTLMRLPSLSPEIWESSKVFLFAFTMVLEYKDSLKLKVSPSFKTNLGSNYEYPIDSGDKNKFYDDDQVCNTVVILLHKSSTLLCHEFTKTITDFQDHKEFSVPFCISRLKFAKLWRHYNFYFKIHFDLHLNRCILLGQRALNIINEEIELIEASNERNHIQEDESLHQIMRQKEGLFSQLEKLNCSKEKFNKASTKVDSEFTEWAIADSNSSDLLFSIKSSFVEFVDSNKSTDGSSTKTGSITHFRFSSSEKSHHSSSRDSKRNDEVEHQYYLWIKRDFVRDIPVVKVFSNLVGVSLLIPPFVEFNTWRRIIVNSAFKDFCTKEDVSVVPKVMSSGLSLKSFKDSKGREGKKWKMKETDKRFVTKLVLNPKMKANTEGLIEVLSHLDGVVNEEVYMRKIQKITLELFIYVQLLVAGFSWYDYQSQYFEYNILEMDIFEKYVCYACENNLNSYDFFKIISYSLKKLVTEFDYLGLSVFSQDIDVLFALTNPPDNKNREIVIDKNFLSNYLFLYQGLFECITLKFMERSFGQIGYEKALQFEKLCHLAINKDVFDEDYFRYPRLYKFLAMYDENIDRSVSYSHLSVSWSNTSSVNDNLCHDYFFGVYLNSLFCDPNKPIKKHITYNTPEQWSTFIYDIEYLVCQIRSTVLTCFTILVIKSVFSNAKFLELSKINPFFEGKVVSQFVDFGSLFVSVFTLYESLISSKAQDGIVCFDSEHLYIRPLQDIVLNSIRSSGLHSHLTPEEPSSQALSADLKMSFIHQYFSTVNLADKSGLKTSIYVSLSRHLHSLIFFKCQIMRLGSGRPVSGADDTEAHEKTYHAERRRCLKSLQKTGFRIRSRGLKCEFEEIETRVVNIFEFCYKTYLPSFHAIFRDLGDPVIGDTNKYFERAIDEALADKRSSLIL